MKKRMISCLCLALLLFTLAAAETLTVDVSSTSQVETDSSYIQLIIPVEEENHVSVSLCDANGSCVYSRDYGTVSADFKTENIMIKANGGSASYTATAQVGSATYNVAITCVAAKLTGQPACSAGYSLKRMTGKGDWQCATLLDAETLENGSIDVPLMTSGGTVVGTVTFSKRSGKLHVAVATSGSTLDRATVYVARTAEEAKALRSKSFSGLKGKADDSFDLAGASCVAVYVDANVSFRAADLTDTAAQTPADQEALWERLKAQ